MRIDFSQPACLLKGCNCIPNADQLHDGSVRLYRCLFAVNVHGTKHDRAVRDFNVYFDAAQRKQSENMVK